MRYRVLVTENSDTGTQKDSFQVQRIAKVVEWWVGTGGGAVSLGL